MNKAIDYARSHIKDLDDCKRDSVLTTRESDEEIAAAAPREILEKLFLKAMGIVRDIAEMEDERPH